MKRREFVAASGVVLGASILAGPDRFAGASEAGFPSVAPSSAGSAPVDESRAKVVDVHQHVIPDFYAAELEKRGMNVFAGAPLPAWSDRSALTYMDAQEVSSAILSLPAPAVCFGERKQAATLARRCNEFMAKAAQTHPARFGGFAAIPQREPGDACVEAVYALDQLGADGVQLLASDGQHFLGEPQFEELIAELDKRKAKVFVHPNMHATSQSLALGTPGYLVEFACDTTRAAVNLILSGTMERYPNISWILAEGGGCLPYVAWRVSLANALPEFDDVARKGCCTISSASTSTRRCAHRQVFLRRSMSSLILLICCTALTGPTCQMLEKETSSSSRRRSSLLRLDASSSKGGMH